MTITIINADKALLEILKGINKLKKKPYEIAENKEYNSLLKSIKEDEIEFKKKLKAKNLKTFKTAKEAFKDAGLIWCMKFI